MLQSQCQEENSPPLNNVFRIAFNLQEAQGHCKFLYQPLLKLGHPTSVLDQVAQDHVQQLLNISENGGSTAPLSSLSPCLTNLSVKILFTNV